MIFSVNPAIKALNNLLFMKQLNHPNREQSLSEREIERNYRKLEIKPADPNRVNCYTCKGCGHILKTIDINYGVTPMFMTCDKCGCHIHYSIECANRPVEINTTYIEKETNVECPLNKIYFAE